MENYTTTDQYIHQLSQILAKLGRSLVNQKDDDSHNNLYWEPLHQKLLGRWTSTPVGLLLPALNLEAVKFQWLDKQMEVYNEVSLLNRNYFEAENLVTELSSTFGIDDKDLMAHLHFKIPDYHFKKDPIHSVENQNLAEWSYFRTMANHMLKDIGAYVQKETEVRIWPHHFDSGIYFQWNDALGIGVGLAMEDDMAGAPYFYISGYPVDYQIDYSKAENIYKGKWIVDGPWKGGILPIYQLGTGNDVQILQDFYRQSLDFLLDQ